MSATKDILDQDIENIAAKVKAGKRVTRNEMARLQAAAGKDAAASVFDEPLADNLSRLSEILGYSRVVIRKWSKRDGAPKTEPNGQYDVVAWRAFIEANGLGGEDNDSPDETSLKARKLLAECETKELKLAELRKEYVKVSDVRNEWNSRAARVKSLLRNKFENELPPIFAGQDAIAIREEASAAIDEICGILAEGGE